MVIYLVFYTTGCACDRAQLVGISESLEKAIEEGKKWDFGWVEKWLLGEGVREEGEVMWGKKR